MYGWRAPWDQNEIAMCADKVDQLEIQPSETKVITTSSSDLIDLIKKWVGAKNAGFPGNTLDEKLMGTTEVKDYVSAWLKYFNDFCNTGALTSHHHTPAVHPRSSTRLCGAACTEM